MRIFCGINDLYSPKVSSEEWREQLAPKACLRTQTLSLDFALLGMRVQPERSNLPGLRIYPVNHAREGDDLANVLGAANPGHGALKPQAKTSMRDAAITAEIQIPLKRLFW